MFPNQAFLQGSLTGYIKVIKERFCVFCSDLDIFVEMHRLIVNVVLHEVIIDTRQQGHLRQREYIHELFHSVSMGTLGKEKTSWSMSMVNSSLLRVCEVQLCSNVYKLL